MTLVVVSIGKSTNIGYFRNIFVDRHLIDDICRHIIELLNLHAYFKYLNIVLYILYIYVNLDKSENKNCRHIMVFR